MKTVLSWVAVLACAILIFLLSDQPASVSKELSGGVKAFVERGLTYLFGNQDEPFILSHNALRKTAHYFIYFVLGFLLMNVLKMPRENLKGFFVVIVVSALFACTDELHQQFILGRSGELRDVMIDTLGAATGALFLLSTHKFIRFFKSKPTS